jgi:hypothetical protein
VDEALAVLLHHGDEFLEHQHAVSVLVLAQILAVQRRLHRVHHHGGMHVVDPEIVVLAVPHGPDRRLGRRLGLIPAHPSGRLLALVIGDHAVGDLDGLFSAVGDVVTHDRIQPEKGQGRHHQKAGHRHKRQQINPPADRQSLHGCFPKHRTMPKERG